MCLLSSSSTAARSTHIFGIQTETKFVLAFIKLFHQVEMNAIKRKDVQFSNENDAFCLCMDFHRFRTFTLSLSLPLPRTLHYKSILNVLKKID